MLLGHKRSDLEFTTVSEPIDAIAGERLRNAMRAHLRDGRRHHVFDLRPLDELDSRTLAALIRVLRFARSSGGSVGLIVTQESFLRILSITALDRVFPIFPDEEAAQAAFEAAAPIPA